MRIIFILILFIVQQLINADDEQDNKDEWKFPEKCIGYGCDYRAQWWYLEKTDEIRFQISTKFRNKWTGIGFSDTKQMKGTDAVIGLVEDNGRYFLMDTYLKDYSAPPLDAVQNIHNMTVWRENGITHLQFHRFRTTSDVNYDFQFTDENCAYFFFVVKGGVFNAVNKRMRKHEETPIISPNKICIRSKDVNKRKKIIEVPAVPIRFNNNVPNKPKIPNRFKARPKLTSLLSTTSSPIQYKSTDSIVGNQDNRSSTEQPTTLPVEIIKNDKILINDKDKVISDKTIDQSVSTTSQQASSSTVVTDVSSTATISVTNTTQPPVSTSTESVSIQIVNTNDKLNKDIQNSNSNSIELNNKINENNKNEDKIEENLDEDDEEATSSTNENSVNKKQNVSILPASETKDGRIKTSDKDNQSNASKNNIKSLNFDLKILASKKNDQEPNSTLVNQEVEKELSDLTGFKGLKLINLKLWNDNSAKAKNSEQVDKIWIADFEMQISTESDTNENDYLDYLQKALNDTVTSGHIGNLMLDSTHYALLRQESNETDKQPEAKYVFEYNFYNQFTIKLTKEQLKLAYIILGVSLLVLLFLMQACCMCCTSNETNDLHKQNNLSNSSTLQDKHQLNLHHNQYNEYIKNCGNNYSYENFELEADANGFDMMNSSSYKMKPKHSLSKQDPMLYNHHHNNYSNSSNSYNRRSDWNNLNYNHNNHHFNNHQFNNHHNHGHNHHYHGSSHLRYYEPQPMSTSLEPDFYFMPKQRINHKCYN